MRARSLLVTAGSLAVVSGVVLQSSTAAMTATTDTTGSWAAGQISLTDNDSGSALFTEHGLGPGSSGFKCLQVTYQGTPTATVKLYASVTEPSEAGLRLGTYLSLTIHRVAVGHASCTDANAAVDGTAVFTGKVTDLATQATGFANGVGAVSMPGSTTHAYRIAWSLPNDNAVQGRQVQAKFTWEAQTP